MEILEIKEIEKKPKDWGDKKVAFTKKLTVLINQHSLENLLDMPDFIISKMMVDHLCGVVKADQHNKAWHGILPEAMHDSLLMG